ncbi:MAG: hypothetical protein QXP82_01795 [Candidatus Aenigmatarchaeota archaeon]|nr:hypothetical protein [Candidatus Aenigmarchaeota archaeon]
MHLKRKGYRIERKIRLIFQKFGWKVIRAGASLGDADLICLKNKKCLLLQIKSTRETTFYYYGYKKPTIEGFPFFLVVDFGYGKIRVLHPKKKISIHDGYSLKEFLKKI